ncbi:CPCC family cysteine-rich protein [Streptococcus varani]
MHINYLLLMRAVNCFCIFKITESIFRENAYLFSCDQNGKWLLSCLISTTPSNDDQILDLLSPVLTIHSTNLAYSILSWSQNINETHHLDDELVANYLDKILIQCPCCQHKTFHPHQIAYQVCPVCEWCGDSSGNNPYDSDDSALELARMKYKYKIKSDS